MITSLPVRREGAEDLLQKRAPICIFDHLERLAARQFQQLTVAHRIRDVEAKVAVLARSEEFAWATKL